ncbi:MAG: hypothetical protein AAGM16_16215 [Pseudomonadota bacterium]
MDVLDSLFGLIAWTILVAYIPICIYYAVRLATQRRMDLPFGWHDFWGLKRAILLFFPHLLTDTGNAFQKRGIRAAMWISGGVALATLAIYLLENSQG